MVGSKQSSRSMPTKLSESEKTKPMPSYWFGLDLYACSTVTKSVQVAGLVDEADWPETWIGSLDQRRLFSSPTSVIRHNTHRGICFSSIGIVPNCTGRQLGFDAVVFIIVVLTNAKLLLLYQTIYHMCLILICL